MLHYPLLLEQHQRHHTKDHFDTILADLIETDHKRNGILITHWVISHLYGFYVYFDSGSKGKDPVSGDKSIRTN